MSKNKSALLLWRNWEPIYDFPAVFSCLDTQSIGGTCSQLLWHAENLAQLGHGVQVLGMTRKDVREEGVEFIGASSQQDQEERIAAGRISDPDIVFLEGAATGAAWFRTRFPKARIVHVGHNIDRYHYKEMFSHSKHIDVYAFVSSGHLADYCVRFPSLRHKFMLIRNIVPWSRMYKSVAAKPIENRIAWVGSWGKKGLRQWAVTMEGILRKYPDYKWTLYGPSQGKGSNEMLPHVLAGLDFGKNNIELRSVAIPQLIEEISSARIVLVSLGNETGCISALDAHAMGRPVLSGNDIIFKFANPEGTGLRCTTASERHDSLVHLIERPELCDAMGKMGRELIVSDYTEDNQKRDLQNLVDFLSVKASLGNLSDNLPPGAFAESFGFLFDRIYRRLHGLIHRG
jgi:glycosyltransferase involved in cell wall biosynthesis